MTTETHEFPVIHLNGTGIDSLFQQYNMAWRSLKAARDHLCDATCHPRDFYPKGDQAYYTAYAQRQAALHHLDQVHDYLEAHVAFLSDQLATRTPRNTSRTAKS